MLAVARLSRVSLDIVGLFVYVCVCGFEQFRTPEVGDDSQ